MGGITTSNCFIVRDGDLAAGIPPTGLSAEGSLAPVWRRVMVTDRFLPCATIGFASGGMGRVLRLCGTGGTGLATGGVEPVCAGCSTTSPPTEVAEALLLLLGDSLGGVMLIASVSAVVCRLGAERRGTFSGRCANAAKLELDGGSKNMPTGRPSGL